MTQLVIDTLPVIRLDAINIISKINHIDSKIDNLIKEKADYMQKYYSLFTLKYEEKFFNLFLKNPNQIFSLSYLSSLYPDTFINPFSNQWLQTLKIILKSLVNSKLIIEVSQNNFQLAIPISCAPS